MRRLSSRSKLAVPRWDECDAGAWKGGVAAALGRKKQLRRRQKKLDGSGEAHLIALACSQPPQGRVSWTLQLLADRLVECELMESISTGTARQTLKKTNSSPG